MGKQQLSLILLRQFKVAVKKMRLLLALYRRVHSCVVRRRRTSSKLSRRWRSFSNGGATAFQYDSESSTRGRRRRSYYDGWDEDDGEDDINQRAENFIADFRHQLSLERQMELRCCSSSSGFEDDYYRPVD
ncbi:hypothetical protein QN277_027238 [Acacia crassicarpa]|uniref:Uncharacterized protein n=1 Tax=Acacia crassicarpa TaxID=499986 RepID=A0AAE1JD17_9FABA|nr:hypothetical protein QN277_027238 [Acacia crassicarpa]